MSRLINQRRQQQQKQQQQQPQSLSNYLINSIIFITLLNLYSCNGQDLSQTSAGSSGLLTAVPATTSSSSSALTATSLAAAASSSLTDSALLNVNDSLIINQILTNLTLNNANHSADPDNEENSAKEYDAITVTLLENVTRSCLQHCIEEETIFLNDFGVECSAGDIRPQCYRRRCFKGCELWWHALKEYEPCQEACSSPQFYPFDLPCISACETSQRSYWHLQRIQNSAAIQQLKPELLLASDNVQPAEEDELSGSSNNPNAVTLKWPITTATTTALQYNLATRPFNIQYQYVKMGSNVAEKNQQQQQQQLGNESDTKQPKPQAEQQQKEQNYEILSQHWSNLADYNCNENFECDIMDGLMPFTSYKFRFELPFGDDPNEVLYSPASDAYTTRAMGYPISKPIILQCHALDNGHIVVFWKQGKFTNGPLKNYRILLEAVEQPSDKREELLSANSSSFIFHNLQAFSNYSLKLSMLNAEGEGPAAESFVLTKQAFDVEASAFALSNEDLNYVLIAGEYSIVLKSLDPLAETRVLFRSQELLKDFDILQHSKRIFVVDIKGEIYSFFVDNPVEYELLKLSLPDSEKFVASKLAVDWLNQRLYVAGKLSSDSWRILNCAYDGSLCSLAADGLTKSMENLQVDPINGWLYALDSERLLLRIDLRSSEVIQLPSDSEISSFTNDFQRLLLLSFQAKDHSLQELSYDGLYSSSILDNSSIGLQGELISLAYLGEHLLIATNGTHIMRHSLRTAEYYSWAVKDVEWCWNLKPFVAQRTLTHGAQALAQPLSAPSDLQALLSSSKAQINWKAPLMLGKFQSSACWQNWEYELDILDVSSNSAFNIRNIKTTHFQVERLQANNLYRIRVRAMFPAMPRMSMQIATTEWSEELVGRSWPMGEYKFLWASESGLYESNELGENFTRKALQNVNIKSLLQINATLFYLNALTHELRCLNLMSTEVHCHFHAYNVHSFDYDWRGGKLYWSDFQRNCIVRSSLHAEDKEQLPIFNVRTLRVDSHRGFVYYTTSESRLMRRNLNGAYETRHREYYQVNGNGEKIQGFTLDLAANQLYWLVQHQEARTKLLRTDADLARTEDSYELQLSQHVAMDSLEYLPEIESLIWLQANRKGASLRRKENLDMAMDLNISDFDGQLNAVTLLKHSKQFRDPNVIPEAIEEDSIHITEGYWDDFNIKWSAPFAALENLTLYYKVLITCQEGGAANFSSSHLLSFEAHEPMVRITDLKLADHLINVTITPFSLWSRGHSQTVQLRTPSATPKQPKNLRAFVQQHLEPLQSKEQISAIVRWDSPDNISAEKEVFYKVFCWLKDDLFAVKDVEDMASITHQAEFLELRREESYQFQVQAFSSTRSKGGEKTALLTQFVNPEIQALPKVIYTTSDFIAELDLDLRRSTLLIHTASEVEHLALMQGEQRVLWVNANVELMSYQKDYGTLKLARMRAEVLSLTVDWIQRRVYWAELSPEVENSVDIHELDLTRYEGKIMMGQRLLTLSQGRLLKNLLILPFSRSLLWLEYEAGASNCSLQGRNLTDLSPLKLKTLNPVLRMFEGSLSAEMESINLLDFRGRMFSYEVQRQLSSLLKLPVNPLDDDMLFERDTGFIYTLNINSIKAYNRRKHNLELAVNLPEAKLIKAFNYQEYPEQNCLLPATVDEDDFHKLNAVLVPVVTESEISLHLPQNNPLSQCKLPMPGLSYEIKLADQHDFEQEFYREAGAFNISQLEPFNNYMLEITMLSYYQQKLSLPAIKYPKIFVRTKEGTPWQPRNFTVIPLSPSEILVSWQEPEHLNAEQVQYKVFWQMTNSSFTAQKLVEGFEVSLLNLEASQSYLVWLEVQSVRSLKTNVTQRLQATTFPQPNHLQLKEAQAYNLTLKWLPNWDYDLVFLVCHPLMQSDADEDSPFSIEISGDEDNISLSNLQPKTKYEFHFRIHYANVQRAYVWPELHSERFIFETLGDAPSRPGQPQIEHITGEIFKIFWDAAESNGAAIIEYSLEAMQARNQKRIRRNAEQHSGVNASSSIDELSDDEQTSRILLHSQLPWVEELQPVEDKWLIYCNTTELSCIVRELHTMRLVMFRVRARNDPYGWGPYSEESERILEPFVLPQKRNSLVLAIILPAAIVSTCVIILVVIRKVQKRRLKAKQLLAKSRPSIWSNFSAIQQQQQQLAARNRAFSMTSNATMYTGGPLSDADIALLPHISWSQISLLNFLGSGAFGEVYEGMLKHVDEEQPEKVAIKTLRKGSNEFAELLQEAQLMSNFKHDNIVRLIGVCCNTESISIIMEHMEGGDLLSYLRESRPNSNKPVASLQLLDLMTMCIDVATGMSYLEDMHFVHRDLACRNCLVSSRIPSKRTVKIGDFGLARDIYKSDYYRKEGEALMPVRWMSPESLVDGVFTTQSDVWAFGVLCWEILTLGQQPYAARNNFEVLNFVKDGGRLQQPDNCPDKLFSLMTECWLTDPDERPSFRKSLNTLLAIKTDVRRVSLGYNVDDSDYAMYANQHGIVLSSFLASPLSKVKEESEDFENSTHDNYYDEDEHEDDIKKSFHNNYRNDDDDDADDGCDVASVIAESINEKIDLKVRFKSMQRERDCDSVTDESHLIDANKQRVQENPDYYINEGISRL